MRFAFISLFVLGFARSAAAIDWHWDKYNAWAYDCDWVGSDIGNAQVPGEQCSQTCANQHGVCTHYTWTRFNGGTCWMKSNGNADTSTAIEKIKRRIPFADSFSMKTARKSEIFTMTDLGTEFSGASGGLGVPENQKIVRFDNSYIRLTKFQF